MSRVRRHQQRQTLLGALTILVAVAAVAAFALGPSGRVNLLGTLLLGAIPLIDAARLAFHYHDSDEYGRSVLLRAAALALGVTLAALTLTALLGASSPQEAVSPAALLGLSLLGWMTLVGAHAVLTWREAQSEA